MPEEIGRDGLIVGQALAHGDGDGLAELPAGAHAVLEADESEVSLRFKAGELSDRPSGGLTSSQVSLPNASQRRESGQLKPNLFIRGWQPALTCSQSHLQGGLGFPDTHLGV